MAYSVCYCTSRCGCVIVPGIYRTSLKRVSDTLDLHVLRNKQQISTFDSQGAKAEVYLFSYRWVLCRLGEGVYLDCRWRPWPQRTGTDHQTPAPTAPA